MKSKPNNTAQLFNAGFLAIIICFVILSAASTQAQSDTLIISSVIGEPGDTVELNIYLANYTTAISGFSMFLLYDPNAFSFMDVITMPRASEFLLTSSTSGDSIRITGYDPTGSQYPIEPGSGDILQLRFAIYSNTPVGEYAINYIYGDFGGNNPITFDGMITVTDIQNDIPGNESKPLNFSLGDNYPNPFNACTNIEFSISDYSDVSLTIYNLLGQKVRLILSRSLTPGNYITSWDGKNCAGEFVTSGVYLYKLSVDDNQSVKKLNFIK